MYKKALALLLICAVFLSMGCVRRGDDSPTVVTPTLTLTVTPAPTSAASPAPSAASPAPSAAPTASPVPDAGWTYIDPSLADVSGDGDDSIPEFSMPTPGPE